MDREELAHLENLYRVYQKRLRVLELKAAWQGLNTPADVLLEIENIREMIDGVQLQIDTIKTVSPLCWA